jgi:transketolase
MRPPVRLAAMMGLRVVFLFSHDSIGLGQDGPTHQPIEQLMSLRLIPNLVTLRPANAAETVEAWRVALERRHAPTAIITSRQNLPNLDLTAVAPAAGARQGGYVLWEASVSPKVILIGTGSEVSLALEAGRLLLKEDLAARVVSLPSWELFDAQTQEYRDRVLPPALRARVSIEAGTPVGWERYVGPEGVAMGIGRFGASAPGPVLYEKFGLTAASMAETALRLVRR